MVQVSDNSSRPLRFRSWNRQSGPSTNRARIHECTNTPGPVAQVSNLQRKSRSEPPRRHGREGFLFLCVFCAFAVQILEPPKRAVHESDANTRMHEYARPGGASQSRLEPPRRHGREGFLTFPLRLCGSNSGTAKTSRRRRIFTSLCALGAFAVPFFGGAPGSCPLWLPLPPRPGAPPARRRRGEPDR